MEKLKIKEKLASLSIFLYKWKWLIFLVIAVIGVVDYYDFGVAIGWGIFSKQNKTNPLEGMVAIFLLLTLIETWKTSKEALRQTELTLRPYMRLAWDATQVGQNRTAQGITDTCIVVVNNGKGLMRQVKNRVKVDGKEVKVRNHSLISPSPNGTIMVYGNTKSRDLGCRNDVSFEKKNNKIIKEKTIEVSGYYRDVEGGRYHFSFVSDVSQQSWFREQYRQQLRNRRFYQKL